MAIKMSFDGERVGRQWSAQVKRYSERQIVATQVAARRCAENIETRGRQQMKSVGDFGSRRWQEGFQATVQFLSRVRIVIRVTHRVRYWRVFQYGATIRGKPMLWIPLSFAIDALGRRARDFPGGLFRVDRAGKAPLLLSSGSRQPKYFGKTQVRIPKKFRLLEITRQEQRRLGIYFREAMRRG